MAKIKNTTPEPVKPKPTFQLDLSLEELALINLVLGKTNGHLARKDARAGTSGNNPRSYEIVAGMDEDILYDLYELTRVEVNNA